MAQLRSELKDIEQVLNDIHDDPNATSLMGELNKNPLSKPNFVNSARKVEELVSLEATYGCLPEFTPVIDTVISYLHQVWIDITKMCVSVLALSSLPPSLLPPLPLSLHSWLAQRLRMMSQ